MNPLFSAGTLLLTSNFLPLVVASPVALAPAFDSAQITAPKLSTVKPAISTIKTSHSLTKKTTLPAKTSSTPVDTSNATVKMTASSVTLPSAPVKESNDGNADELSLLTRINAARKAENIAPLTWDPLLNYAARLHCKEMCDKDYFDHISPTTELKTPADRYLHALQDKGMPKTDLSIVGENCGYYCPYNGEATLTQANQDILADPAHRFITLDPHYTKVGVGVYQDSTGQVWITEMFLQDTP